MGSDSWSKAHFAISLLSSGTQHREPKPEYVALFQSKIDQKKQEIPGETDARQGIILTIKELGAAATPLLRIH